MFWDYACSHFFLDRDGVRQKYLELGGSGKYEPEWRAEYISHWVSRMHEGDLDALNRLSHAKAYETIPVMLEITDYGDDYSKFWYAFTLADLGRSISGNNELKRSAHKKAVSLWNEIIENPCGISKPHRSKIDKGMLEALDASSAEEYIRNYTESKLKQFA